MQCHSDIFLEIAKFFGQQTAAKMKMALSKYFFGQKWLSLP